MAKSKRHCPLTAHGSPCIYEPGRCLKCRAEQLQAAAFNLRRIVVGLRPLPSGPLCRYYEPTDREKSRQEWIDWQQAVTKAVGISTAEAMENTEAFLQQFRPRSTAPATKTKKE